MSMILGTAGWTGSAAEAPEKAPGFFLQSTAPESPFRAASANVPPEFGPLTNHVIAERSLLVFTVTASDPDVPVQQLTFSLGPGAPAGAALRSDGLFTWAPTEAQGPGTNEIALIVTDNGEPSMSTTQTVLIEVLEINWVPELAPLDSRQILEGETVTFQAMGNDVDLPAQQLTYRLGPGSPPGAEINPQTGVFTWTPAETQGPGNYQMGVIVTDDGTPPLSVSQGFLVIVLESNLPPVLLPIEDRIIAQGSLLVFAVPAADPDIPFQQLTFSLEPGAPAGAALRSDGLFTWAPTPAQAFTTNQIAASVTDGSLSATQRFTIVVTGINFVPTLAPLTNHTVGEGESITFTAVGADANVPAQQLTYRLGPGSPPGAEINPQTGVFTWTPAETQGPGNYQMGVIVTDDGTPPLSVSQGFLVTVVELNRPPVLASIANQTINQGGLLVFTAPATDPDIPFQQLTYSLEPGAPTGAALSADGLFTWAPGPAQAFTTNQIGVIVSDGSLSATQRFTIVVTGVNFVPVLAPLTNRTVGEGELVSFTAVGSDFNVPAQELTYRLGPGSPPGAQIDPQTGVFTWTPAETQGPGNYQMGVIVTDDGTPPLSASQGFLVTVEERNLPPVLAPIEDRVINQGGLLVFATSATDSDFPFQQLTFSLELGAPAGAALRADGLFTWSPSGAQAFTTNRLGAVVTDGSLSTTQRFTIVVTGVNFVPVLAPLTNRTVGEGELVTFTAVGSDINVPAQELTYRLGPGSPPGAQIDPQTGVFTWTPAETQGPGNYQMGVIVTDDGTPPLSASQGFLVTVEERNQPPVLAPIEDRVINQGSLLVFTTPASDPDVPFQQLTFNLGAGAPAGAALSADGLFTWAPNLAQSFTSNQLAVIVTDGSLSATQRFTLVVTGVNIAPTLAPISGRTVGEGELVTVAAVGTDANVPAQRLTYQLGPGTPSGAVIDPQSGVFIWTPAEDQGPGSHSISMIVTDDGTPPLSGTQSFLVTVEERNLPPELEPVTNRTVSPGSLLNFSLNATDPDIPAQSLVFSLGAGAPAGSTISSAGLFAWTPSVAQSLTTNRISAIVSDGSLTATQSFVVTVLNGAIVPPRLVNPLFIANTFSASVDSHTGRKYFFERTHAFEPLEWIVVGEFLGIGGTMSLTDPAATNATSFYRARVD